MPYLSEQDISDIMFGCDMGFDFLAASFVRCKEDILSVRKIIEEHGSKADEPLAAYIRSMKDGVEKAEGK